MLDKNRRFFKLGEIGVLRILSTVFDFYHFFSIFINFSFLAEKIKNIFSESVYLRETGSEVTI